MINVLGILHVLVSSLSIFLPCCFLVGFGMFTHDSTGIYGRFSSDCFIINEYNSGSDFERNVGIGRVM